MPELAVMMTHWIIWSQVALYAAVVAGVILGIRRRRRAAARLLWSASTTQRQMEIWGSRFLERKGWQIGTVASQATITIKHCKKDQEEMFLVFLRDSSFFRRLVVILGKFGGFLLQRLVIVLYDPPSDPMRTLAFEQKIALAHFLDLPLFDTAESARQPGLTAVREIQRKIKVI